VSLFLTTPPSSSWKRSRRQVTSTRNQLRTKKSPESFLKQKLASLRAEADTAVTRAEAAEAKNKLLEQALLEKEQEIKSKDHRLDVLEGNYEETSAKFKDTTEKYARIQSNLSDLCSSIDL
jgi:chromosome segregation ATPase